MLYVDTLKNPENATVERLFNEAPYLPRCSDNKTAALVRPRKYAFRFPYMQVNRKDFVSWLVFDLDHENPFIWEDSELPTPNIVVINPKNGHAHLFYAIAPVCTSENARSAPIRYMKSVYEGLAARLKADVSYGSGPVAKTPGHKAWKTIYLHHEEYDLGTLADYIDLPRRSPWTKSPDYESISYSRNNLLFEELRFYAYSIVNREREQGDFISFTRLLEAFAHNKNNFIGRGFTSNLPISEVGHTVKSVARWTWDKYRGDARCHRGVMNLNKNLPLIVRQRRAAERTHKQRANTTAGKIRAASLNLMQCGKKVTQIAIAEIVGVTRQTVAKYKNEIHDALTNGASKVTPLRVALPKLEDVKYAVHQITAALLQLAFDLNLIGKGCNKHHALKIWVLLLLIISPPD